MGSLQTNIRLVSDHEDQCVLSAEWSVQHSIRGKVWQKGRQLVLGNPRLKLRKSFQKPHPILSNVTGTLREDVEFLFGQQGPKRDHQGALSLWAYDAGLLEESLNKRRRSHRGGQPSRERLVGTEGVQKDAKVQRRGVGRLGKLGSRLVRHVYSVVIEDPFRLLITRIG
jgi:hypothetical protein